MTFCPECGKPVVPPSAKFCRNCGASQLVDAQLETMPAPATLPLSAPAPAPAPVPAPEVPPQLFQSRQTPPASPQPPAEPVAQVLCSYCGSPLDPEEKYCGVCGKPAGEPPSLTPPAPGISVSAPVSICASCGSPLAEKGKFCGVCGASVNSVNPPPPLPPPISFDAPPAQQPTHPPGARLCRSCGNPIKPGDKFCSKCLAKVVDDSASASEPLQAPAPLVLSPPPPSFTPTPSPPPAQPPGVRLCRSCGNPITPGDKFCSKCLAKVADDLLVTQVQYPPPASLLQPLNPPASLLVCASCGSPIPGTEKFCGICGTPVLSTFPVPSAPLRPVGKTCTTCGAPVSAMTKFCGGCGAAVGAALTPVPVSSAPPAAIIPPPSSAGTLSHGGEEVIGVIGNARKMKMFGASWDSYNIVVTGRRMIIAQMTQAMLNAAIMEAQAKAKAEGKGFLAIMKDQMAAQFQFTLRYETMSPDMALAETAGNRAIDNARITAISMKLNDSHSGKMEYNEFRMIIESLEGKFEFMIGEDDRFIHLLRTVYGDRVHMPFGYFKAGGARIKFF